jgi:hypothetical protein
MTEEELRKKLGKLHDYANMRDTTTPTCATFRWSIYRLRWRVC